MSGLQPVWLVARREFMARGRSRAFILSTIVVILFAAGGVIATKVGGDFFGPSDQRTVGLIDVDERVVNQLVANGDALDLDISITRFEAEAPAMTALRDGDIDALLIGNDEIRFDDGEDNRLVAAASQAVQVTRAVDELQAAGLPQEAIARILSPEPLTVSVIEDDDDGAAGVAFLMAIVLFTALLTYGQWILMGVVEEKSNRVVEVLLATLRPAQLLAGKVLGILGLSIIQMLIGAVALVAALVATGHLSIPSAPPGLLAMGVVWFMLGLLFYSLVYAAIGATVSRQEDATTASSPVTMVLTGVYFASIFVVVNNADGVLARVLSFLPLSAPVVMPVRMALQEAAPWETAVSLGIMVVSTIVVTWLGARLYAGAVLHTGPRLGVGQMWRTMRAGWGR